MTDPKSYKETVLLPQTSFDMRANATKREPEIQAFWAENHIYETLSTRNPGEVFVLHDGPPYANATACGATGTNTTKPSPQPT